MLRARALVSRGDEDAPTSDGKLVLREAMRAMLGYEAADRPKQGFGAPDAPSSQGASRSFVDEILLDPGPTMCSSPTM